jgi:endonuclease-3
LILWEQVAYLVPDAQRRAAYQALRSRVGLTPRAILAARPATLRSITRLGGPIAAATRAARLQQSARLVLRRWQGKLGTALTLPLAQARRALGQFPMIGDPGADKILAITRTARLLPLDSNALRVLHRLDLAPPGKDYGTSYRQAQAAVASQLPKSYEALLAGSQLLRQHGQELCRRSAPRCPRCPLRSKCPYAASPGINAGVS